MELGPTTPQPSAFYDGGLPPGNPRPDLPAKIMLERIETVSGREPREAFRMMRRIAYRDEEYGEILVPADLDSFETDFASVPTLLTWLVPRTGTHLPAALIHDGLVGGSDYVATRYPPGTDPIDRVGADLVFRRAMRDSYIPLIRRWLVWSAVTLGTIWDGSESWSRRRHLRYLVAALGSLLVVAALGVAATLDLFDVVAWLPWMGADRGFLLELVGGLAGAVVIPLLLGVTWGRFAVAGVVTGIALAVLLHVTFLLLGLTAFYQVAERVARRTPVAALVAAAVVLAASLVLTVLLVGTSG
ncbi:DUF1353 domain-containing protein [Nocardioides bizhenqiangii]|uniref:DUF1353 domain-containing protein n=1 Tax=Nocardioides bizhenqiangii TaxID=3095076 RepID=A0ABZ0ZTH8_9ACTN|nr:MULTISPECIES: DUF1353 domain-containing protein [unclassified Nocardioides]MDZ5621688.1 DUF1353 domain-containing protein [Nocardioides sp. HM23]WQQ27626.1 DUF1353 domain-containing protein [Nocardioides sp. HM61]